MDGGDLIPQALINMSVRLNTLQRALERLEWNIISHKEFYNAENEKIQNNLREPSCLEEEELLE